jgi:hypothetical protein
MSVAHGSLRELESADFRAVSQRRRLRPGERARGVCREVRMPELLSVQDQDQARRSTSRAPGEFPPAGEVRESLVQTVEGTADRLDILGCLEVEDEEHLV